MKKVLYKLFRKDFIKYLHEEKKPVDLSHLELRFKDDKHGYYGFPDNLELPVSRFLEIKNMMLFQVSGVTHDEAGDLLQIAVDNIAIGLSNPENAAMVMKTVLEMKRRRDMLIQPDMMVNEIAYQIIRDDENPAIINKDIHREKCEYFKELILSDYGFFFRLPELRRHREILRLSPEEFIVLWHEQLISQAVGKDIMRALKSENGRHSQKKTLTNS